MINVRTPASGTSHCVRRLIRIESFVDLTDLRSPNMQLKFRRQRCSEGILTWFDISQPLHNTRVLFGQFGVRSIHWNRWIFQGIATGVVISGISRRVRNPVNKWQVLPDSNDDNPMPGLRNTIFLKLVQMGVNSVACGLKVGKNFAERPSFIRGCQPADIFCEKPFRMMALQNTDAVCVERAVGSRESLLLAYNTEIIAWKTESQRIDRREIFQIKSPDILTNYGAGVFRANIMAIGLTCGIIEVIRASLFIRG